MVQIEDKDVDFLERKDALISKRQEAVDKLDKAKKQYDDIKESNINMKEKRLTLASNNISRAENVLNQINGKIQFMRPKNEEDIKYRLEQYDNFSEKVNEGIADDLPLRFHGCPIYTAKDIIDSGTISSSMDRLGISTSYDTEGQISVTTNKTIETTIHGYTDLTGNYNMPAGCIFVLLPKDQFDESLGSSMLMENVDFKKDKDRLVAVISTPENQNRLQQWFVANDLDKNKIVDFNSFVKNIDNLMLNVNISYNKDNEISKAITEEISKYKVNMPTKEAVSIMQSECYKKGISVCKCGDNSLIVEPKDLKVFQSILRENKRLFTQNSFEKPIKVKNNLATSKMMREEQPLRRRGKCR